MRLSPQNKKYIYENAGVLSRKEMASAIGCSCESIDYTLRKIGISGSISHKWCEEEVKKLMELWKMHTPTYQIAQHFHVSKEVIYNWASRLRKKGIYLENRQHNRYK